MLTVYVPAERFDAVVPAAPFDQLMLYGAVPLLIDTVAEPNVAQFWAVELVVLVSARPLFATFTDLVALHPLASVIVTV